MNIRKVNVNDAEYLKELYCDHLSKCVTEDTGDIELWKEMLSRISKDDKYQLLVVEEDGKIVSSLTVVIIDNLTHGLRPYAVMENVVTHDKYRNKGYGSALIEAATNIAREYNCYKIMLMTGSNRESTLNFYKKNGFSLDEKRACLKKL